MPDWKYLLAWYDDGLQCFWAASIDAGKTFTKLNADDENRSHVACEEAAELFNVPLNKWEFLDESIKTLTLR